MIKAKYTVEKGAEAEFNNHVDDCVGTGRMGLALQKEYHDQLKIVQDEIGFKHIRGHGLFSDDMAIYQAYTDENGEEKVEYNFTYLDRVMDDYISLGLRPFLELGFMPYKLASGEQTLFYWKGNTTPPKSDEGWTNLVIATLSHLMERYGADEAVTWPIEVWNEPNLPGFWKDADMPAYFHLFEITFRAIKAFDERFCVGGPAVCGGTDEKWIRAFLEFCAEKQLNPDFITRHHYTINFPENAGHYRYNKLVEPKSGIEQLHTTRVIIDSFPQFAGKKIMITEFNTSYTPQSPLHDTNMNAAHIAAQLSMLGNDNASYSYWTFGDVFEEAGVPFTPFYGGFGLVTNGLIKKPTFYTFKFFNALTGKCVLKTDESVVCRKKGGYNGVIWNLQMEDERYDLNFSLTLPADEKEYCLMVKTVDESSCNPLKVWHDMGEPSSPSKEQVELLRESAVPDIGTMRLSAKDGKVYFALTLSPNAVVYFELLPVKTSSDRGYDYDRVVSKNG